MALNIVWLQKMARNACRKTSEDHLWRLHQKTVGKSCMTTFWAKILCIPKNLLAPTPVHTLDPKHTEMIKNNWENGTFNCIWNNEYL